MNVPKVVSLLAVAALACRESLRPADYAGTYALRTVNATAVPASAPGTPTGCTVGFQSGSLTLDQGVFSMECAPVLCCQGTCVIPTWGSVGGSIESTGGHLVLRAIYPSTGSALNAELALNGGDAILTLPEGAFTLATATTLVFGPRQAAAAARGDR